jgi:hypothetical protein
MSQETLVRVGLDREYLIDLLAKRVAAGEAMYGPPAPFVLDLKLMGMESPDNRPQG